MRAVQNLGAVFGKAMLTIYPSYHFSGQKIKPSLTIKKPKLLEIDIPQSILALKNPSPEIVLQAAQKDQSFQNFITQYQEDPTNIVLQFTNFPIPQEAIDGSKYIFAGREAEKVEKIKQIMNDSCKLLHHSLLSIFTKIDTKQFVENLSLVREGANTTYAHNDSALHNKKGNQYSAYEDSKFSSLFVLQKSNNPTFIISAEEIFNHLSGHDQEILLSPIFTYLDCDQKFSIFSKDEEGKIKINFRNNPSMIERLIQKVAPQDQNKARESLNNLGNIIDSLQELPEYYLPIPAKEGSINIMQNWYNIHGKLNLDGCQEERSRIFFRFIIGIPVNLKQENSAEMLCSKDQQKTAGKEK